MAARSIWNGAVAIGEIVIPVKLFSVVQQQRIQFREVRLNDGCRITHRRVGAESGEEVATNQIHKLYQADGGREVVLTDEEITAAQGERSKVIEIEHFTKAQQIDPIFYDRPYILGAQAGGEHAYRLLHAALQRSGKVGIGRFVLRTREQLVALAAHDQALRLYTMRFADELVDGSGLNVPTPAREPSTKEIDMAQRLIDTLASTWEPAAYEDRHRAAVMAVIERKATGAEIKAPSPEVPQPVPDLLAALQRSVEEGGRKKKATKSAPTRRRAAPTKSEERPKAGKR